MYQNTRTFRSNDQLWRRKASKFAPRRQMDVSLFVKKAQGLKAQVYNPKHSFQDFQIAEELKHNIISKGFEAPTPIQDQAIPEILSGRDVIGLANTGTGKTAAFLIPFINKSYYSRNQRVLIIAPTRELAIQIEDEFKVLAKGLGLFSSLCIGGLNINSQIRDLRRMPDFVIGTPGRLRDLEKQRVLSFNSFNNIVLDEVDRMLDMGFIRDIRHIITQLPHDRHSLFFSATIPSQVQGIMQQFLNDPVKISVQTQPTSENVDQDIVKTRGKQKIEVLEELLQKEGFDKVILFGRTKWGIEKLSKTLHQRGFKVASIHGNKSQSQRQLALENFKKNKIQVLLATDIAARGIDVVDVTHVINYDMPGSYEDYIHRIGRTGRASKSGVALTFVD
jgi:ATP-dependent RNA helicase RhlE